MSRSQKALVGLIIALCITFITVGTAQLTRNNQKTQDSKTEEPTVIAEGVMTDRQREHSKLFVGYGVGKKITDLLKTESEVTIVSTLPATGDVPFARRQTFS